MPRPLLIQWVLGQEPPAACAAVVRRFFFFQAEDGIRYYKVTGVQTCALPISGKGKSSILFIIDYCLLASETKGISKTNIDSKVDWYGIRLTIDGKELVIARPSEAQQDRDRAYFSEDGIIPERPTPNIRIDNLKRVLNKAFGIDPELKVPYGGKLIQAGQKVSFRNFLAHCYQDQTTIIAPD